jgi:hypothetical protein
MHRARVANAETGPRAGFAGTGAAGLGFRPRMRDPKKGAGSARGHDSDIVPRRVAVRRHQRRDPRVVELGGRCLMPGLIVVDGDPVADLSALSGAGETVRLVMKGGAVFKDTL